MSKKLLILLSTLYVLLSGVCIAQENLGARPMGMGGAFAGLADDANAIFSNPAGISYIDRESVVVSSRAQAGREYTLIGGVETTPFGNLGIGFVGSSDPINSNLNISAWDGEALTKYSTQTLYVSFARDLSRVMKVPRNLGSLSLGLNLKVSSRKLITAGGLSRDGGSNVDLDLATVFKPNPNLSLGLSVQNFMSGARAAEIQNLNTIEERRYLVLFGASGKVIDGVTWTVEGDNLGCEWRPAWAGGLSLRAGTDSYGAGINLGGFGIDYAYVKKTEPVSYLSVSIAVGKPDEVKKAGMDLETKS